MRNSAAAGHFACEAIFGLREGFEWSADGLDALVDLFRTSVCRRGFEARSPTMRDHEPARVGFDRRTCFDRRSTLALGAVPLVGQHAKVGSVGKGGAGGGRAELEGAEDVFSCLGVPRLLVGEVDGVVRPGLQIGGGVGQPE